MGDEYTRGGTVSFTTLAREFAVSTGTASNITAGSVSLSGSLAALEGYESAECRFQYRETGASSWTETDPEPQTSPGDFSTDVSGLAADTEFEWRAHGSTTLDGEAREVTGETATFTTDPGQWTVETANEGAEEESEIYVYEAPDPGPVTLGINIHASERAGIDALEGAVDEWEHPIESGTLLVWPAPCPSAEEEGALTCNGEDLNEAFDLEDGPQTSVAQAIEDEIVERDVEYLLDFHARPALYEEGGEGHAVFPAEDNETRPISQAVVAEINDSYQFDTDEEWQVGNNINADAAENEGMLATYAWEEHGVYSQIPITWSPWPDNEQIEQHQRAIATTLDEAGHGLGDEPANLIE